MAPRLFVEKHLVDRRLVDSLIGRHDTQHNDTQHTGFICDTQHYNNLYYVPLCCVSHVIYCYAECLYACPLIYQSAMELALENVNNCLNTNIYFYLETSGGQSSNLYLNAVHFFNTCVN